MNTRTHRSMSSLLRAAVGFFCIGLLATGVQAAEPLIHDAEYYILAKQHGEAWAKEDKALEQTLADFRKKNGGKPPNIFYILIDDIGFGDQGSETLNMVMFKTIISIGTIKALTNRDVSRGVASPVAVTAVCGICLESI